MMHRRGDDCGVDIGGVGAAWSEPTTTDHQQRSQDWTGVAGDAKHKMGNSKCYVALNEGPCSPARQTNCQKGFRSVMCCKNDETDTRELH